MKRQYLPCRTDANQQTIMDSLRKLGYSVESLHRVGNGVFDLLVSKHGMNWVIEVKDGLKVPSARQYTDDQRKFNFTWQGARCVVTCQADVLHFHASANIILEKLKKAKIALTVTGSMELQYRPSLY